MLLFSEQEIWGLVEAHGVLKDKKIKYAVQYNYKFKSNPRFDFRKFKIRKFQARIPSIILTNKNFFTHFEEAEVDNEPSSTIGLFADLEDNNRFVSSIVG